MARKNVLDHVISESQSMAASFTTDPTVIQFLDNLAYQINCVTNNSQGIFSVEASLDYVPADPVAGKAANSGTWVELNLSGPTLAVPAADTDILIDLNQLPYKAVRLKYTSSVAGTGTCAIYLNSRQLGG